MARARSSFSSLFFGRQVGGEQPALLLGGSGCQGSDPPPKDGRQSHGRGALRTAQRRAQPHQGCDALLPAGVRPARLLVRLPHRPALKAPPGQAHAAHGGALVGREGAAGAADQAGARATRAGHHTVAEGAARAAARRRDAPRIQRQPVAGTSLLHSLSLCRLFCNFSSPLEFLSFFLS